MKLLIEISEDTYNYMVSRCKYQNKDDSGLSEFEKVGIAIKNGTPLPKGHGRLIDADAIDLRWSDPEVRETLDDAPTIIEADKGEQE